MTLAHEPKTSGETGSPPPAAATAKALPRLCVVTTVPIVIRRFLTSHLKHLSERFDVTLVANGDCGDMLATMPRPVRFVNAPIERKISVVSDARALVQLTALMRREKFDGVVTVAPKAGLIGILAAAVARIPYRCHVFQGEVWATRSGPMRAMLRAADALVDRLATETLVVSNGERQYLIDEGLLTAARSRVLGAGSISGVDTARFTPDADQRRLKRAELGLGEDRKLILFLGRLQRDKGVLDLVTAWSGLALQRQDADLAIVGPDEDDLIPVIRASVPDAISGRLHMAAETRSPETWMMASDILCLPSYREGFGTVMIEAAACGLPTVSTRIYGLADSTVEGVTGLVYSAGDTVSLAHCLVKLVDDAALRERQGQAGRAMAVKDFEHAVVVERYVTHWAEQCRSSSVP